MEKLDPEKILSVEIFLVENLTDQGKIIFVDHFPISFFAEIFPNQRKIFFVENFQKSFFVVLESFPDEPNITKGHFLKT